VAANAIKFAADLVKGNLKEVARAEFEMLNRIGWKDLLSKKEKAPAAELQEVKMPDPKPVAEEISGIDVLELEDMVKLLWSHGSTLRAEWAAPVQ